ncbi:transmembrane protein 131 isoform X2 [Prorops nasuta]|uniref:transmembrane protein 131 isoform X2 n=1 Tax=Prorops nasuta TaxID=863751 RepID=UPI0034CFFC78
MFERKLMGCLLVLTLLNVTSQIQPSLHGQNNAFVQEENNVHYLLDNIPISVHKDFTSTVRRAGDSATDEASIQNNLSFIHIEPQILDFKEKELGLPHQKMVTLFNKDHNRTIHLISISGNTRHFHSSFFQDKVIPPLGNTTFQVVFLGREEGEVDTHIFIHTSDGILKYQVKGVSISSPYRLRPVVGVKLPLNASFTPLIYIHNPHSETLQVIEVYSSGGEFQLELPSGEAEGPKELWEIPPYQTKPIIRLHFNAYTEKNHTAYIRFKVNNSADNLVVAVEVEVKSKAGLHWGGSSGIINLGMGGSLQPPIHYPIALKNSARKPVKIVNIISTPVSKALKLHFEPAVIPGDTSVPVAIGTMVYDWKTGLELQHFKGKLMIKAVGSGGSSQKLAIPWVAQVLQGGLEVNASLTHYCSPQSNQSRNFTVVNKFKIPLAITNVTMASNVKQLFSIRNFIPRVIKPEQKINIFSLLRTKDKKNENMRMESSILIHSNVSVTEVPLLSYDGKLKKIIPGEKESDKGTMNFGTVGSGTENEAIFALENQNPVNIELHGWGVNMPGAVLELMGCQIGPVDLFSKEFRNITACSPSGNQYVRPNYLAIFKIKVKTPAVVEDTIVGDVFVRTTYERFILPVYMRVAHGKISMKKLTFTDCFPGSICVQQVKVHSTFSRPMEVTNLSPITRDDRIKYIPLEEAAMPMIAKGDNLVGSIKIDPAVTCKQHCYLGLSLETNAGAQWLNTLSLPSHTRDFDLNLLNTQYDRFLNTTDGGSWDNVTMQLDTTEVRGHKFHLSIKPSWPSLLINPEGTKNNSVLLFPLTQVGNTSYKMIKLQNPSLNPVMVQVVLDWNYPQGARLYHSLPANFKPTCTETFTTIPEEFKLDENANDREWLEKQWNTVPAPYTFSAYLKPLESKIIRVSYTPLSASQSSALLYIRNNMTVLEAVRLVGRGAHAQFRFGNRKPGSNSPLLFDLADKHLKDCEYERSRKNAIPSLTVKRSFTARNTGELPIDVYGFYINGLRCEGYGFRVLNCAPFKLHPNSTKKVEIAFTPDFTLSRVERKLLILTSLGSNGKANENGVIDLNLMATLPPYSLELCGGILERPSWERIMYWTAVGLSIALLICILAFSSVEADHILSGALDNFSRENPVQPPLDFRLLSHVSQVSSTSNHTNLSHKDKTICDGKAKASKKDDSCSNWSLMHIRGKKDGQKGFKIPDWSAEEERRFKLDTVSKDLLMFRKCEQSRSSLETINTSNIVNRNDLSNFCNASISNLNNFKNNSNAISSHETLGNVNNSKHASNSNNNGAVAGLKTPGSSSSANNSTSSNNNNTLKNTVNNVNSISNNAVLNSKKKANKKQNNNSQEQYENNSGNVNNASNISNASIVKSESTFSNDGCERKSLEVNKTSPTGTRKTKEVDKDEPKLVDHEVQVDPIELLNKQECKKTKDSFNENKNLVNSYKKFEPVNNQKINQLSEEDTSSSTTDGSIQEDGAARCKVFEENYTKSDKHQRKPVGKKSEYKDNYEGDCDDDDYDKDRQDNPNRWKTSTTRSNSKHHIHHSHTAESSYKLPRQNKNLPRKDKASQKRKVTEKTYTKGNARVNTHKEEVGRPVLPNSVLPPPPTCWGENRAKFSDVVARNQEATLSNNRSKPHRKQPFHDISAFDNLELKDLEAVQKNHRDSSKDFHTDLHQAASCFSPPEKENTVVTNTHLVQQQTNSQQSNSFFINSFIELPANRDLHFGYPGHFERELVPYDDLPETDEPMVELESPEKDTRPTLWDANPSMMSLSTDNYHWGTIDNNWGPLYTRTAVGEERSGVWGINTGGVWAAAPWGETAQLSISQHPSSQRDKDTQEKSGFDPFRSLTTIWTPASSDTWKTTRED